MSPAGAPPSPGDDPRSVPIREAATVVLVRDGAGASPGGRDGSGVEAFLQHRVSTMQFAPNMTVFPGGGVEERDRADRSPWSGPDAAAWGEAFHVDPPHAAAAVRAAVRELFEETGVLLARPDGARPHDGARPGAAERAALDAGECSLDDVLGRFGLVAAADLLRPFDRWITPVGPPRRYDTLFFLAVAAEDAAPDAGTSEARHAGWMRAADALAAGRAGEIGLLPPTSATLAALAEAPDVATLMATPRSIPDGGHRPGPR